MIDRLEAVLLGVVQGATEFLPVSSSGHLVIAQHLFGLREPALLFDIVLHVATLLAVVWYYRRDIGQLILETFLAAGDLSRGQPWSSVQAARPGFRLAWLIVVGTLPTAVMGITLEERFEALFGSLAAVGIALCLTGLVLLTTYRFGSGTRSVSGMRVIDALLVGLAQGLAITPGLSRSGLTIAAALALGVERETAARFSFLLSVPSIVGALLLKAGDAAGGVGTPETTLGFLAALISGYLCLALLVRVVKRGRLAWFAPYCFLAGLAALLLARVL